MTDRVPPAHPSRPTEYDSERDMQAFWAEIRPRREPMQRRWFLPAIFVLLAISIPWYRRAGEIGAMAWGLPVWVWVALGASGLISVVTAVMSLFFWDDEDDERPGPGGGTR